MAKDTNKNDIEKTYNAKAKRFIKYDSKFINAGETFQVKDSDVEELKKYAEIEVPVEQVTPTENGAADIKVGE